MPHPLDNLVWNALTGPHAHLAEGEGLVRRYPPAIAPFHGMPSASAECLQALADFAEPGVPIALFTAQDVAVPPQFEVMRRADIVQMVREPQPLPPPAPELIALGEADAAEMFALARATQPGPFSHRTHELGGFFGIRVGGRLVAMAGERMRVDGHTEVSAVCTLDAWRGHGYGGLLVDAVSSRIFARGERAFLHAFSSNLPAIGLYRKLGFVTRGSFRVTGLQLPPSGPQP